MVLNSGLGSGLLLEGGELWQKQNLKMRNSVKKAKVKAKGTLKYSKLKDNTSIVSAKKLQNKKKK